MSQSKVISDSGVNDEPLRREVASFCDRIRARIEEDQKCMAQGYEDTLAVGRKLDRIAERMKRRDTVDSGLTQRIDTLEEQSGYHSLKREYHNHLPTTTLEETFEMSLGRPIAQAGLGESENRKSK